jgi:ribose transport system substrate-binding protein
VRFLLIAALLVCTACNRGPSRIIGVVPKGSTHEFWLSVKQGAEKAAREGGYEIQWNAPAQEGDRSRQIAIVDAMINQHVAGIALAPCDRTALSGVVDRATDAGIPVIIFDSGIDTKKAIGFVGTNNREAGRVAARRLGEIMQSKGLVAVITDTVGSASTTERDEGFAAEMKERFPAIRVLPLEYCEASRAKARAIAENLLSAHAELNGIFADHENATAGAALAVKGRNLHNVKMVGFDTSEQLVALRKEGWIDSLVVQAPERMGEEAVRGLMLKIQGGNAPKEVDTGVSLARE